LDPTEGLNSGTLVLATFTDTSGGSVSASVNWGDSTSSAATVTALGGGNYRVSGSHTFTEETTYLARVTFSDSAGGSASVTDSIIVADAGLSASGYPVSNLARASFTAPLATVTDANPSATTADFQASVDWGDGSSSAGIVTAAVGQFRISGTHSYSAPGKYVAHVLVRDDGGASVSATAPVTISALPGQGLGGVHGNDLPTPPVLLNEVEAYAGGTPSAAYQYVEITGPAPASLSNLYFVEFSGGATGMSAAGTADTVVNLSSYSLGSNGLLLLRVTSSSVVSQDSATTVVSVTPTAPWGVGALLIQPGSQTDALVSYSGTSLTAGTNYDPSNTGTLSNLFALGATLVDAIGWGDLGTTGRVYAPFGQAPASVNLVLPPGNVLPGAATRLPGVTLAATKNAWYYGQVANTSPYLQYDVNHESSNFPPIGGSLTPGADNAPQRFASLSGQLFPGTLSLAEGAPRSGVLGMFTDPAGDTAPGDFAVSATAPVSLALSVVPGAGDQLQLNYSATPLEEASGPYTVTVRDLVDYDHPLTLTGTLQVNDAPLGGVGAPATLTGAAGTAVSGGLGQFLDGDVSGTSADYSVTAFWGDGSSTTLGATSVSAGPVFGVSGSHTYGAPGIYQGTLRVADQGGASAVLPFAAQVATSGALGVVPAAPTFREGQGTSWSLLGTFQDSDANTVASSYSLTLSWCATDGNSCHFAGGNR
jgi:hypothetical protein